MIIVVDISLHFSSKNEGDITKKDIESMNEREWEN